MNNLQENNYIHIPNFIGIERAKTLSNAFIQYAELNNLEGDRQVENSQSGDNFIDFLELLCEKIPEVSKCIGETVLPTYTYSRVYKEGATLGKHTDRDACEISITLHLDGDEQWPFYIERPNGETASLNLNPGDAILYLGCVAPHWRERFTGKLYTQVFLHYVRSRGDKAYTFFDKDLG